MKMKVVLNLRGRKVGNGGNLYAKEKRYIMGGGLKSKEEERERGRYGDTNAWLDSIRDEHAERSMWQLMLTF